MGISKARAGHLNGAIVWTAMTGMALGIILAASMAHGDETTTGTPAPVDNDPFESVNRVTSDFNRAIRDGIVDPLVDGYQYVTPQPVQETISNVFSNLTEPVTAVSSMIQGDTDNAGTATKRFLINSTIGLGGAYDRALDMGYAQRREDLGQAFGAQGVESGPHIVLPILGPSNFRDLTGDVLTGLASPLPLAAQAAGSTVEYSNNQDTIQSIGTGAIDPYVAEREAYEQNRAYQVTNGKAPESDFPTFAEQPASLASQPR
jgi:phospholipid-binding lipoprotein MlaA